MERGCGKRKPGGLYLVCTLSPFGKPIEHFLFDPPVEKEELSEPFRAPILSQIEGRDYPDVFVWIGEMYYPEITDFIEEVRVKGASRRIPSGFPIENLGPGSRMVFVHPKAVIKNPEVLPPVLNCPKGIPEHENGENCIGLHYYDKALTRTVGDHVYPTWELPDMPEVEKTPGIFMWLSITGIDLVQNEDGSFNEKITEKTSDLKLPLNLVEE